MEDNIRSNGDMEKMGSIPHLSVLRGSTRHLKSSLVHKLFENVSDASPDQTALIFEESSNIRKHTYRELNEKSNQIAHLLVKTIKSESLPRNSDGDFIVAVCMPPSDTLVTVLLGIWKAGGAYLPLDPTFPGSRIEHILKESKPVIVIYEKDSEYFGGTHKVSVEEIEERHANFSSDNLAENESVRHLRDDLAIVLYTSGSTGVPKGVRLPHKVILNRLQWQFKTFPYSETESIGIFKTALTFVDSVSEIWGPLLNGLSIVIVPKAITQDPEKLITILETYKIERLVLVPSLLRSLLMFLQMQKGKNGLRHLTNWICSGETLAVSLAEEFFKYFTTGGHMLCNFYGSTEIMGDVSFQIISNLKDLIGQDKVPIGLPVDNTILYLLDKDYRPVSVGEIGELFVSGLNLAAGYVNGRDKEKFIENPLAIDPMFSQLFKTGDYAKLQNGTLHYEGRTDSQVKIRGHRVDLSEVENAINTIAGINKCVVLCYKPGEINQALLSFITSSTNLSENQLEAEIATKLSAYMVPQVIVMDDIPLLVNGKIDRQALLTYYENTNNNDDSIVEVEINYKGVQESQRKAATILFETVASVLGRSARSTISTNANFYEIGGNSLNSIFTIAQLSEKGYYISIGDFIAAMDLGEVLERMTPESESINMQSSPPIYRSEMLNDRHKADALDMITTSFYQKADLEQWLMPDIKESDYSELMDKIWAALIEKELSFVTISEETDKIVGVGLNFDAHDEPEVEITSKLIVIFEFLEFVEGPIRDNKLPTGKGKVLHSFMMATHSSLAAKDNVAIMNFMEDEVLKLARRRQFTGILTTNTSPLTQQLGSNVYGYKTMLDYQVNAYVAPDNTKPFGKAPDSQRAIVHWKEI